MAKMAKASKKSSVIIEKKNKRSIKKATVAKVSATKVEKIPKSKKGLHADVMKVDLLSDNAPAAIDSVELEVNIDSSLYKKVSAHLFQEVSKNKIMAPKDSVADVISQIQQNTIEMMRQQRTREAIINTGNNVLDTSLKILFSIGFTIAEIDESLFSAKIDSVKLDQYYVRLDHPNFSQLATDEYRPNLLITFRGDPRKALALSYCVYFPSQDAFFPLPAHKRADIVTNWQVATERIIPSIKKEIINFLNKIPAWSLLIEQYKERRLSDSEISTLKKQVTLEILSPARINQKKFLWPSDDTKNPFLATNMAYKDNKNLFNALMNILMVFSARKTIENKTRRIPVKFFACEEAVFEKKNGKLAEKDIFPMTVKFPISFTRRTSFAYSNIGDVAESLLISGVDTDSVASFFEM